MKLGTDTTGAATASLAAQVQQRCGENPARCYQCGKCTAGCPVAFAMDIDPARLMRNVQLGQRETVLHSRTIWLCASCETCTTRCPQGVDLARVMDALRILAREAGIAAEPEVAAFNQGFLSNTRAHGRVHESLLAVLHNLKTGHPFRDVEKGPTMLLKGKMSLRGHTTRNRDQVRRLFEQVEKLEGSEQ